VESVERVMEDYERVVAQWHDRSPFSMSRVAFAPCAPFNAREDLFRETARLARHHGVLLHTHLAETADEDDYCQERFGKRPLDYVADLGWEGPDVWFAHCVMLNEEEVRRCAETGTGVAHCPSANARLGSGIAPVRQMLDAGVRVGLGVDGSSSNDCGSLMQEARTAFLMHRASGGPGAMSARDVLKMATRGGALILQNDRIGRIAQGCAADVVLIDMDRLEFAGGGSLDPLATLVFCGLSRPVDMVIVNGRVVVDSGTICNQSEVALVWRANEKTAGLIERAQARHGVNFLAPTEDA